MSLVTSHCAHSTQHTAHSMHVLSRARGSRKRRGRRSDRDCEVCQYCVSSVPRVEAVVVPIDQPAAGRTGAQQKHTVTMAGSYWARLATWPVGLRVWMWISGPGSRLFSPARFGGRLGLNAVGRR